MEVKKMCNKDLRDEMRIANVRQWEVAEAIGISEMTMVKWLRRELDDNKKALVRNGIATAAQQRKKNTTWANARPHARMLDLVLPRRGGGQKTIGEVYPFQERRI